MKDSLAARDTVTAREWRVFTLIGCDRSTRQIAETLCLSVNQVYYLRTSLAKKIGLSGRRLVVTAVKCVWIREHDPKQPPISSVFEQFYNYKIPNEKRDQANIPPHRNQKSTSRLHR